MKISLLYHPLVQENHFVFPFPFLLCEGMTIVLSPFRSLIYDQVEALKSKGITCDLLNGDLKVKDRARVYGELSKDIPKIKTTLFPPESVICNDETMFCD